VRRVLLACLLASASPLVAACGEKDEPEVTGPPVASEPADPSDAGGDGGADGSVGVELREIGEFSQPVYLAQRKGDESLYIVEKEGRVLRVGPGGKSTTALDISNQVSTGSEQGLLSIAFPPDTDRLVYAHYTNKAGDTRVVEYAVEPDGRFDPRSERTLLSVAQPFPNHNGGLLLFDAEGNLLIGLGDGGSAGDPERNGQDLGTLLGKILRIDPRPSRGDEYAIPGDNPHTDESGARPEILAYGLRNPWRFSFDRKTGALWIGDVGQNALEEVDVLGDPGEEANFGWSAFEGTERFNADEKAPGAIDPVLTYGRESGCSITGGYVVRDRSLDDLYGRYLYADFCQGQLRSFDAGDALASGSASDDASVGLQVPSISSFAEDESGRIYALSLEGPVFRLAPER
jgi:glucose/arabinose dehydrogenase